MTSVYCTHYRCTIYYRSPTLFFVRITGSSSPRSPRCPAPMDDGVTVLLRGMKSGELMWACVPPNAFYSRTCPWHDLVAFISEELAKKYVSMVPNRRMYRHKRTMAAWK